MHPLERLTAHLGGARVWTKRDDVSSGLAYGGNKTRKLEYLVADALATGCDTLVSIGGVRDLGVVFDTIVVCSVTGSTQAGMIAGFAASAGPPRRVIGIDGSAKPAETRAQVARIARRTAALLVVGRELCEDEIVLDDRWHAGTYGIPTSRPWPPSAWPVGSGGMLTDPVYEGKSMAGLIDLVASGEIERHSTVLYAHLGGQPALSAYASLFCRQRRARTSSAARSPSM